MNAEELLAYDRRHVWHPYATIGEAAPPVFLADRARGARIALADGTELVDAVASWWCVAHGHNHPAIVEAVRRQSERMSHVMFGGFTHEPAIELVALQGGYHGDTCCAMALSDPDGMHALFRGIMPRHFFAAKPRTRFGAAWEASDFDSMLRVVEEHGDEIAAMICEPVFQAANAMWFYHPRYLAEMRRLCDERGILLVFDEIAAGLHRTGPRWAHEHAGPGAATPDILCVGKALTGGHLTLAATIASERVAETISRGRPSAFMHGPTYMANPLACAAGCASLDLFAAGDYAAEARRVEARFRAGLAPLKALPNVADVRVLGAVGVAELRAMPRAEDVRRVILETGVWLRPFANFVYSIPPFVATDADLDRICEAIRAVCELPPGPPPDDPDFHE